MEVDMVAKAFDDMVFFHAFFMAFFPIPFLINLFTLFTYKTYQKVIIKLWFVMPIIFLLVAIGSFTGIFIMASAQWYINWRIAYVYNLLESKSFSVVLRLNVCLAIGEPPPIFW